MLKILAINSKPNLDFFTKRGLLLDITYDTCTKIFPTIKTQTATTADNKIVTLYSPDVHQYLEDTYKTKYDVIFFGWNPKDYGTEFAYTGGQTFRTPLSNGSRFATVRQNGNHEPHEMMHLIGNILYTDLKKYDAVDQMDSTWVDGKIHFYYKNEFPEDPDSNFGRTWDTYKKYLPELNNIMPTYKYFKLKEKTGSRGNHTIAELKPELVSILDLIRGDAGIPFIIESGKRTQEENKTVGGATNSAHLTGEAVDIRCLTSENRYKIITSAIKHGINRIGIGSNYIHLDISKTLPQNMVWHYYK